MKNAKDWHIEEDRVCIEFHEDILAVSTGAIIPKLNQQMNDA
jgi:hypothetical protein